MLIQTFKRFARRVTSDRTDDDRNREGEAGFTLLELLVVMVIMVMLAGLIAPRVLAYVGTSKAKAAKIQIQGLSSALELYKLDTGRYPTSSQGLKSLVRKPAGVRNWAGPYMNDDALPRDPWGNSYKYKYPGSKKRFDIVSLGADHKRGGEGEDADVRN